MAPIMAEKPSQSRVENCEKTLLGPIKLKIVPRTAAPNITEIMVVVLRLVLNSTSQSLGSNSVVQG